MAAGLALRLPADEGPVKAPRLTGIRPTRDALCLCGFSVLLGAGISAVNTYVALFGARQLMLPTGVASALVAVLGVAAARFGAGWVWPACWGWACAPCRRTPSRW